MTGSTESLSPPRAIDLRTDEPGQLWVVVGLRCDSPLAPPAGHALGAAKEVVLGRGPGEVTVEDGGARASVTIDDPSVSSRHARLIGDRDSDRWWLEDLGSKNGTGHAGVPVRTPIPVTLPAVLELGRTFVTVMRAPAAPAATPALDTLDPALARGLVRIEAQLAADATALLVGETGAGKEVIARAIHRRLATRHGRTGELVAVNCAALPAPLVESELFGHRRGAFSGAVSDRVGYLQAADGGTLLLDEVGDLPAAAQGALLRALQERTVTPIGATQAIPIDVRVISATHRDLGALVRAGRFRADLLARIAGTELRVPALRDRPTDLGPLVGDILRTLAPDRAPRLRLRREAARALFLHLWPANVRELVAVLRGALAIAPGDELTLEHLPPSVLTSPGAPQPAAPDDDDGEPAPLSERRRAELLRLLDEHQGNVAAVARALGRHRSAIFRWLRDLGIDPDHHRR